jgi:hypothetical protein
MNLGANVTRARIGRSPHRSMARFAYALTMASGTNPPVEGWKGAALGSDLASPDHRVRTDYWREIDRILLSLADNNELNGLLHALEGIFPVTAASRLEMLDPGSKALSLLRSSRAGPPKSRTLRHEPHPLDFEWFFTERSSSYLARHAVGDNVLCLGTPSLAKPLSALGRRVTLVDQNLSTLREIAQESPDVALLEASLPANPQTLEIYDTIYLDPPWSVRDLQSWLNLAWHHSRPGTTIHVPLLQRLVRPSAPAERNAILELASQMGEWELRPTAIHYQVPRFEYEVLRHFDISMTTPWRIADHLLVTISAIPGRSLVVPSLPAELSRWITMHIAGQTIKIRRNINGTDERPLVAYVPGCSSFLLPTVSSRDPRRGAVELWTSRNRVARIADTERVIESLTSIANSCPHESRGSLFHDDDLQMIDQLLGV